MRRRPSHGMGAGGRSYHLQDELVRLTEATRSLAESLISLFLIGVRSEEQQLRQMSRLQAPGLHAHEHLPQLTRGQLQMR